MSLKQLPGKFTQLGTVRHIEVKRKSETEYSLGVLYEQPHVFCVQNAEPVKLVPIVYLRITYPMEDKDVIKKDILTLLAKNPHASLGKGVARFIGHLTNE